MTTVLHAGEHADDIGQSSRPMADAPAPAPAREKHSPQHHRTVDRITRILEEVVYNPGMTFAELVRALGAAKSSVHGFIRGLVANGWLYEDQRHFYLGPAVYGLTMASGHIRAGLVTQESLLALQEEAGFAVFLGVQAGDHLIYIAESGSDPVIGFDYRTNIRRNFLATAGGKALLATRSEAERDAFLRRHRIEEGNLVEQFLEDFEEIRRSRIAANLRKGGSRMGLATAVSGSTGRAAASITLVGPTAKMQPRKQELGEMLLRHVESWRKLPKIAREAI
jgi:DNA-binding IclR family transcriptional regulator